MFSHLLSGAVLRQCSSQTVEPQHSFLVDSPVLALYDPFGVDVPLNFDIINQAIQTSYNHAYYVTSVGHIHTYCSGRMLMKGNTGLSMKEPKPCR